MIFIPFVYFFNVNGYFYAFLLFNVIASVVMTILAFKPLKGKISLPDKKDFVRLFKEIFSISIAIYIVKILYTNWEKLGSNVLGLFNSAEVVAIYAFAMLYAKKLMSISDSVTTVNIPVFSEKYVNDENEFKKAFTGNFNKIFSFIVFVGSFAAYFAPLAIRILVGSDKYDESIPLIAPMVFAFIIYSFINIISSSVMIPAKLAKSMIASYVFLILGTALTFLGLFKFVDILQAASWAMVGGSIVCLYFMHLWIKKRMKFTFLNIDHVAVLLSSLSIAWLSNVENIWVKIIGFGPFALLLTWSFIIAGFISKKDILSYLSRFKIALSNRIKK
jgi:O-antigen/teichoic acid export membrane protein